jgi:hypothetical protein
MTYQETTHFTATTLPGSTKEMPAVVTIENDNIPMLVTIDPNHKQDAYMLAGFIAAYFPEATITHLKELLAKDNFGCF